MSAAFLLTAFVVALVPGTGVVYTVATASFYGVRLGMAAVIGCTLGIVPALLATVLGLATLLHTSALAFVIVKYAGAAYLLYLAWATLRAEVDPGTSESQGSARDGQRSWLGVAWFGFLINILNPKLSAFFLALLPQFVDPASEAATAAMLMNGIVFMLVTLVVFAGYAVAAATARAQILGRPRVRRWLQRCVAGVFAAMGLRMAGSELP